MKTEESNPAFNATPNSTPNCDAAPTQPAPAAPIRLWLVDDDDKFRQMLAEVLALNGGVECTRSFGSANAALSALASQNGPDIILLDVNIGAESGLDAVRPILSLSRSTRVLMFTTFFDPKAKTRALDDGASGFLLKQYSLELILESIRNARSTPAPTPVRRRRISLEEADTPASSSGQASRTDHRAKPQKTWRERIWNIWSRN